MPPLPPFTFRSQVTAEHAREDKIEISLGKWVFNASSSDFQEVRDYISVAPIAFTEDNSNPTFGWIFNRPSFQNQMLLNIRTRRNPRIFYSDRTEAPLFSGECRFQRDGDLIIAGLHLTLNPLRFIRHQVQHVLTGDPDAWPNPQLNESEVLGNAEGEYSLDGEDNWLPMTPPYFDNNFPAMWPQHIKRYIEGVGEAFRQELARVTSYFHQSVNCVEHFSFKKVEVAFEFRARSTTSLVRNLIPILKEFRGGDFDEKEHPPTECRRKHSLSFLIGLRSGIALRLYAKTNRRIRFELIFDDINHRELLGEPEPMSQAHISQPRPWNQIYDCLANLRTQAATEMNAILRFFRGQRRIQKSPITPLAFIVHISSVLQDTELAATIIELLTEFPVLVRRDVSSEIQNALQVLAEVEVLRFDRNRGGYVLRPFYHEPVAVLRSHPMQFLQLRTSARQRRRIAATDS